MLARTRLGLAAARPGLAAPVVLVPTMGALHAGHRAPLRRAREMAGGHGSVVVSVFVNPLQFGPGEDLARYPRTLSEDIALCAQEGAALIFAPAPREMYPREQRVTVSPGPMGETLEGAFRPGFFGGVLTVVLKLFCMVRPDAAVFGEKDAQQLALIAAMAQDLDLGVQVVGVPTVRDSDGLAASSRNSYLSAPERATALRIPQALKAGERAASGGPGAVLRAATSVLAEAERAEPALRPDYLELVDPAGFEPVSPGYVGEALLLVAARVGATRLIDNMRVAIPPRPGD